ncbi:hypothetical protein M8J76_015393 [Diaphorina citri]|nr:hypothetical protein M8J76_015393 [Diaphorina citri]
MVALYQEVEGYRERRPEGVKLWYMESQCIGPLVHEIIEVLGSRGTQEIVGIIVPISPVVDLDLSHVMD